MKIKIHYFSPDAPRLKMTEKGDWIDLYAAETMHLSAGEFTLIPLGKAEKEWQSWGCRGCKRDAAFVADYVSLVNRAGGVVAIDVHVNDDGSFEPDQLEVLRAVGRRTGTLK